MYAVVLAGGCGTRLWPLSRAQFPKQFINITDKDHSLFQGTLERIKGIIPENHIIVVTHREQENNIRQQLDASGFKEAIVLTEPKPCNTAPAIGLAAWFLSATIAKDKEPTIAVLPSDHFIPCKESFVKILIEGRNSANNYGLVTFGIKPDYPETGYGYILCGARLDKHTFRVEKFEEKPGQALAKKYVKDENYLWNSGMFVFKVKKLMDQYRHYLPSLAKGLDKVDYINFNNLEQVYNTFDSISIDYGLLEKTTDTTVVPADIAWSDVGSWDAVYNVSPRDAKGNFHKGRILSIGSENTLAISTKHLVGLIDVKDIFVVSTEDAFLVCSRGKSQQVKELINGLQGDNVLEYMTHPVVHRPWGDFVVLADEESYKVKKITVKPGGRLSLQSHRYRCEHWLVAKGQGLVTIDDEKMLLAEGEYIFIPIGARHRLENPGEGLLEIIEIQKGSYFGEDDIIRYEDDYGRRDAGPKDVNTNNIKTAGQILKQWMESDALKPVDKEKLREIAKDPAAVEQRFGTELAFGTGGLRGVTGIGLNRMNVYTVRRTTQGLADYINKQYPSEERPSVAIAYDTRHFSREFALEAARVLAANKIKALIFSGTRPTPQLSFVVRELGCVAGIVITASHNPSEYNGYKVYGPDGGQAVSPLIDDLTQAISAVDIFEGVSITSEQEARDENLLQTMGPELDRLYVEKVSALSLSRPKQKLNVVFTPLHGTGACFIPGILGQNEYISLTTVGSQMTADPDFPTVKSPNPEDKESFAAALDIARRKNADLVMATDPDCDRLGCAIRDKRGEYHLLTGSQTGALLTEYILGRLKEKDRLPKGSVMIKTIVTGDLGKRVAASYNVETIETLTGFKYIGEKIKDFETPGSPNFVFGYEESHGYLAGTFVRDKDANIAALLIAEMAAYYKERGQSLLDVLKDLFEQFDYYEEDLVTLELKDEETADRFIDSLNRQPPEIANMPIAEKRDYSRGKGWSMLDNRAFELTLPPSKALYYRFKDGSWFCVRPSGTEPKLKLYFSALGPKAEEAKNKLAALKNTVLKLQAQMDD